nr:hypothetical protein [Tanacetum cinerariifolium]
MLNHDSSIIPSSSKIDSLLDEFAGELTLLKSIPSRIDKTGCYPEDEIRFTKRLFDSHMEEIDLTFTPDDPMPPGIEDDDDDSKRDILILEELPRNYSPSLPENESFRFDIPSFSSQVWEELGQAQRPKTSASWEAPHAYHIPGNVKTLGKGFYPSSLYFLSFNWES